MINTKFVTGLSIVNLRVAREHASFAAGVLDLAAPLSRTMADPASLWLGPDNWLLISAQISADDMIANCQERLAGQTWNATNASDALSALRLSGVGIRELLSSGAGLDFNQQQFPVGASRTTRFAQIPITISTTQLNVFELLFDRSYKDYIAAWISSSENIVRAAAR